MYYLYVYVLYILSSTSRPTAIFAVVPRGPCLESD